MSKEQVMDYVMNSPANTNPNVLSGMLDGISGTQLPSLTESDNGKLLGVDGGEYKLVEGGGGRLTIWLSSSEGNKYQMYRDIHKKTSMSIDELVQAANEGKTIVFQILGGSYAGAVGEFLYTPNTSGVVTANLIVGFGSALQAKLLLFRITWDSYENAMIARVAEVAYT